MDAYCECAIYKSGQGGSGVVTFKVQSSFIMSVYALE